MPEERSFQLKFLYDKVSNTVTGEELKGINDECLKVALVDSDGNIVTCGSGSDAKVEILLLDVNENGGEENMSLENFERRIIQTGEKKKPHFAKSVYKSLKEGVADLNGLKLGHDKDRIKKYSCRLGARIVQNLDRTTVLEAWTAPFMVVDKHDTCKSSPLTVAFSALTKFLQQVITVLFIDYVKIKALKFTLKEDIHITSGFILQTMTNFPVHLFLLRFGDWRESAGMANHVVA